MRPDRLVPACAALIAGSALFLSACGNKGPLVLPPPVTTTQQTKAVAAGAPAKAADHSSAPAANNQ